MNNGFSGHFTHVHVFSATKAADRDALGDRIGAFIARNKIEIVHTTVTQSSDSEFHCVALFYKLAK